MPESNRPPRRASAAPGHGLARVLARRGACSRSEAERWIAAGRVGVEGRTVRDAERRTRADARITVDGREVTAIAPRYLVLNKPRGLITSAADERGRDTVYALLAAAGLPWLAPVGRLDRASEGLLLMSNDSIWAAALTAPAQHVDKTYRVQVRGVPDAAALAAMRAGVSDRDEYLAVKAVALLRSGGRTAWLEIVLDEGRNRHIRRLLAELGFEVLRLIRIAIGPLALGELGKGCWRELSAAEVRALARAAGLTGP